MEWKNHTERLRPFGFLMEKTSANICSQKMLGNEHKRRYDVIK